MTQGIKKISFGYKYGEDLGLTLPDGKNVVIGHERQGRRVVITSPGQSWPMWAMLDPETKEDKYFAGQPEAEEYAKKVHAYYLTNPLPEHIVEQSKEVAV